MKRFLILFLLIFILFSCNKNTDYISLSPKNDDNSIQEIEGNYYVVTTNSLKVKSEPTYDSNVLAILNKGDMVIVTKYNYNDDFSEIMYNGKKSYIS